MLTLYGHPFSSYTQKVLIALYETATPFDFRLIAPEQPENCAEWLRLWPLRKFPVLVDGGHHQAETSIIIEYLGLRRPETALLPTDPVQALPVRFMDRFFDQHVMTPMQLAVEGALGVNGVTREGGMAAARDKLDRAYDWLNTELADRNWACGAGFTMADCAAAPALFYADWVHPIANHLPVLRAYRSRLLARPSVARVVAEARPYRPLFPLGAPDRD